MTKSKIVAFVAAFAVLVSAGTTSAAYMFNTNLGFGMRNSDVKELQMRLNAEVATTLPGTTYFGSLTKSAVQKYQAMKSISTTGFVGPLTRAALNGSTAPSGNLPAGCTTTSGFSPISGAPCNGTTGNTQTGPVTAMISATTPASGTLVATQATADLAHFTFTGTGAVTNVTLQRIGVSGDTTLSNVYLFDGATRLTDAASVSNNGMITFTNGAGLFTVSGSKTISVKSDILTGTSGQTVGVKLVSFVAGGTTVTANVSANLHSIASATLATVSAGTITPSGATINPGAGVTVWQSTLNVAQRDVKMGRFAIRQVGSASASSFANFKLYVNGVQVGSATGMDSMGYVTFDMAASPVLLTSGSRIVRVDADVLSGASRTVHFSVRQAADIDFIDSSYMVNITPTSTPWTASTASTISGASGGSVTVEKDTTSPSQPVSVGANDVKLGTFKVTAYGEAVKIETLRASFTTSDADIDSLRNGKIMIGGVQYGLTATLMEDSSSPAYTSFTTNYTVNPGTSVLIDVYADMYDNDGTNNLGGSETFAVNLEAGSSNASKMDSLGYINVPAAQVVANTITASSASLTVAKSATYANQTVAVPQTSGYKIGQWNMTGSSVEDVLITTLSFDVDEANATTTFNEADLTNLTVLVKDANGNTVASPSPLGTVSAADNNFSINYTLAKNASATVELWSTIGSTITNTESMVTDLTVTGTASVSGTAISNADVAGQEVAAGTASVTATRDASSSAARIVADNQTIDVVAYKFETLYAGYTVTDLTFTIADASNVSNVMLYDGATLVATKAGATTVTFNGVNWAIGSNSSKVLTVKLQLGTVGVGAGTSGASLLTTLTAFTATSGATGVSAAGTESNPASNATYVYASIPTIEKVAFSSTDALQAGENTLLKFSITSNGGAIEWDWLFFEISKTADPVLTDATLWDVTGGGNTEVAGTDSLTTVGATNTAGSVQFTPTAVQQVSGTKTYELRMTAASVDADVDYVVTKMAQDATYNAPDQVTDVDADTDATIIWSDVSASGHATTTNDWSSDYGVKSLPLSQTISS